MKMDLSGLEQFRASSLLNGPIASAGVPMDVSLDLIDFDPKQPRRTINEISLAELAESIKVHGVLEPVSLRAHPDHPGRYIVNRGERRVRASRLAGKRTVPAFLDDRYDPYAQAIENLQREDLSPFDLAIFIAEREHNGDTRAAIARKLQKPASFITEAAGLIDAPDEVRVAFDNGRARDTRVLYLLVRGLRECRVTVEMILAGDGPITRDTLDAALNAADSEAFRMPNTEGARITAISDTADTPKELDGKTKTKKLGNALFVEHQGRRGQLGWTKQPNKRTGEVLFEDGTRKLINLAELKLLAWTTR